MKIVFLFYDNKNYSGGPAINAIRLLPELKKRGHEVIGLVGHIGNGYSNAQYLIDIGIHCITYIKHKFSYQEVKFILNQIREINPDVFVSNISTAGAFAGRWIQKWGIPVIHTHRGDNQLNNGTAHFFFKGPEKWRLTALVSVNQFLIDQLNGNHDPDFLTKVIPSGVPIANFIADQSPRDRIRIVYSGRIAQVQKRVEDMVDAFIALAHKKQNLDFTIIGDGDEQLLKKINAKISDVGLTDRFFFFGRLHGNDYKKELAKSHIIVLLSDFEGIPGAVMDGMECGLVPIVLDVTGIRELILHMENGILVKDRGEDFYNAIELIESDARLRQELSQNARATIVKGFSLQRTTDLWEELFKQIKPFIKKRQRRTMPVFLQLPKKNPLLVQHNPGPSFKSKVFVKMKKLKNRAHQILGNIF